jgi:hypothetical protein
MTEVNEEIVKQYLELQGFFVQTDVKYLKSKDETDKKSSGWGDVDIVATHPDGRRYLVEVKGWHMESFSASYFDDDEPFVSDLAKKKAAQVLGTNSFKVILVVPEIGSRSRDGVMKAAKKEGIDELWEFPTILAFLINNTLLNMNYDSEVLQMIRLLKQYLFVPLRVGKLPVFMPPGDLVDPAGKTLPKYKPILNPAYSGTPR